ncbi:hypothetical protein KUCAC02_002482, partial [Chaenocephalus aceratus]
PRLAERDACLPAAQCHTSEETVLASSSDISWQPTLLCSTGPCPTPVLPSGDVVLACHGYATEGGRDLYSLWIRGDDTRDTQSRRRSRAEDMWWSGSVCVDECVDVKLNGWLNSWPVGELAIDPVSVETTVNEAFDMGHWAKEGQAEKKRRGEMKGSPTSIAGCVMTELFVSTKWCKALKVCTTSLHMKVWKQKVAGK